MGAACARHPATGPLKRSQKKAKGRIAPLSIVNTIETIGWRVMIPWVPSRPTRSSWDCPPDYSTAAKSHKLMLLTIDLWLHSNNSGKA